MRKMLNFRLILFVAAVCVPFSNATTNLTTTTITDSVTGRVINAVGLSGINTCHLYFTAQTWDADSEKLVVCANMNTTTWPCDFLEFDTTTNTTTFIDSSNYYHGVVSPTNKFYYTKGDDVYSFDMDTHQQTLICTHPDNKAFYGVPSVSNDGSVMTVYWRDSENKVRNISKIDTSTGTLTTIIDSTYVKSAFDSPYDTIDHPMVNPVYKDLFFYCRNGDADEIPDRIWVYDENLDQHKNTYVEQLLPDDSPGEGVGHEMWAYNGLKLYFVKYFYPVSQITPTGLMWVDKWDSSEYDLINGDEEYLHAAVSSDERWLVADTKYWTGSVEKMSDIYLIDLKTKKSKLLARVNTWTNQPGHVHPSFSPDNSKVTFTFADSSNNLWVGYIDISDITEIKDRTNARTILKQYPDNDGIDFYDTSDTSAEAYTETVNAGSIECRKISSNKKMYFDVDDYYVEEGDQTADNDVAVEIKYYDTGSDQLRFEYNSTSSNYQALYIQKANSNTWKTKLFMLENAEFQNAQNLGSDFRIHNNFDGDEYISEVLVHRTAVSYVDSTTENYGLYMCETTDTSNEAYTLPTTIGGRECRKIYSNKKMYFEADDFYVNSSNRNVVVCVTYYDSGSDQLKLEYNSTSNNYQAVSITKTNTNTWLSAFFHINDAKFQAAQNQGNDFRINNNFDGDEYICKVKVFAREAYSVTTQNIDNGGLVCYYTSDTGHEAYTSVTTVGGLECRQISSNKKMYFNADDNYVTQADRNIALVINYYDSGTDQLKIEYNSTSSNYDSKYITKTNTGQWKKSVILIDDAKFRNLQNFTNDFRIHNNFDGDEYIREVRICLNGD
ncbi:MAG: hypothetical protein ACIAQZ_08830 [Sedimentisphaeraceae bacterium JB056]